MPNQPKSPVLKYFTRIIARQEIRYLIAGGWNTVFGYGVYAGMYYFLHQCIHYLLIAVVANVIAITMAYATHKIFVFRTKGNAAREYLKFYGVYGLTTVLGLLALPLLIEVLKINPYIAPLITIAITIIMSYLGHKHFSFK